MTEIIIYTKQFLPAKIGNEEYLRLLWDTEKKNFFIMYKGYKEEYSTERFTTYNKEELRSIIFNFSYDITKHKDKDKDQQCYNFAKEIIPVIKKKLDGNKLKDEEVKTTEEKPIAQQKKWMLETIKLLEKYKIVVDKQALDSIIALGEDYVRSLQYQIVEFSKFIEDSHTFAIGEKKVMVYMEKEQEGKAKKVSQKEVKKEMRKVYKEIVKILKYYMDISEEDYILIATWIIGTWFHKEFSTYPYLFFNAMKGSGKSRLLNLITYLSKDGEKLTSLTEAVLFREKGTLCIDEFEGVGKKGNENLRELLNTAYKKGGKVKRMRKIKAKDGEKQVVEVFEVYRPIVMANIWGIEEVLSDRCIEIILEKSNNPIITKIIENFDDNFQIMEVVGQLSKGNGSCGSFGAVFNKVQKEWNNFVKMQTTTSTSSKPSKPSKPSTYSILYSKIDKTELEGRDLELFLPLFLIANKCGNLKEMLEISIKVTKGKKERDIYESKDIQLYDFISQFEVTEYIKVSELTQRFKSFIGSEEKDKWPNTWWLGQALKRLKLIKEKKRSNGMLVILDIDKAKEKVKIFKESEVIEGGKKEEQKKIDDEEKIEVIKIK